MTASDTTAGQDEVRSRSSQSVWRAANNGAGKLCWFVCRGEYGRTVEYYETADGERLVRFGSMASAQRKADQLNQQS